MAGKKNKNPDEEELVEGEEKSEQGGGASS